MARWRSKHRPQLHGNAQARASDFVEPSKFDYRLRVQQQTRLALPALLAHSARKTGRPVSIGTWPARSSLVVDGTDSVKSWRISAPRSVTPKHWCPSCRTIDRCQPSLAGSIMTLHPEVSLAPRLVARSGGGQHDHRRTRILDPAEAELLRDPYLLTTPSPPLSVTPRDQ